MASPVDWYNTPERVKEGMVQLVLHVKEKDFDGHLKLTVEEAKDAIAKCPSCKQECDRSTGTVTCLPCRNVYNSKEPQYQLAMFLRLLLAMKRLDKI